MRQRLRLRDITRRVLACSTRSLRARLVDGRYGQRGPVPALTGAEGLATEVVGEVLGLDRDTAMYRDCQRHSGAWFPPPAAPDRTTYVWQAAKLWFWKEQL